MAITDLIPMVSLQREPDAIEARYKNGVLQVHMRKLAPEQQRLHEIP